VYLGGNVTDYKAGISYVFLGATTGVLKTRRLFSMVSLLQQRLEDLNKEKRHIIKGDKTERSKTQNDDSGARR
jgi:hypothetical protein